VITDQEKISKVQSLFLGNDPLSSWGRYIITRLVYAETRADRAEFRLSHRSKRCRNTERSIGNDGFSWTVCDDPRHEWTQAQWQQAAKERIGVE